MEFFGQTSGILNNNVFPNSNIPILICGSKFSHPQNYGHGEIELQWSCPLNLCLCSVKLEMCLWIICWIRIMFECVMIYLPMLWCAMNFSGIIFFNAYISLLILIVEVYFICKDWVWIWIFLDLNYFYLLIIRIWL